MDRTHAICHNCGAPLNFSDSTPDNCTYCGGKIAGSLPHLDRLLDSYQKNQLVEALALGNKIEAIKIYREIANADLATAKREVERIANELGRRFPDRFAFWAPKDGGQKSAGFAVALFVSLILGSLLWLLIAHSGGSEEPDYLPKPKQKYAQLSHCTSNCQPVATGLKGLRWGMSLKEARRALPALKKASRASGSRLPETVGVVPDFTFYQLPGSHWRMQTTIGDNGADCELNFAVEQRLSRMHCTLVAVKSIEDHEAAETEILQTFLGKYGAPAEHTNPQTGTFGNEDHKGRWLWQDGESILILESGYQSYAIPGVVSASKIVIENLSKTHQQLQEQLTKEAKAKKQAERDAAEAAKQRELEERLQQKKDLKTDL